MKPYAELTHSQQLRRRKIAHRLGVDVDSVPESRGSHGRHVRSEAHHKWTDSLLASTGYVKVRVGTTHPLADPNGYAYEHLVVWVSSGRERPKKGEVIHHRNENKKDNRIENLELMASSDHSRHHIVSRKVKGRPIPTPELDGRTWMQFPVFKIAVDAEGAEYLGGAL